MNPNEPMVAEVIVDRKKKLNKLNELEIEVKKGDFDKILALENILKEIKKNSEPEYEEKNNMFLFDTMFISEEHYLAGAVIDNRLFYLTKELNCVIYKSIHKEDPDTLNIEDNHPFIIAEQLEKENFYFADFIALDNGELFAYGSGTDEPPIHNLRFLGKEKFINKIIGILWEDKKLEKVETSLILVDDSYSGLFEGFNFKAEYNRKENNKITFI